MDKSKITLKECTKTDIEDVYNLSKDSIPSSWSLNSFLNDFQNALSTYTLLMYNEKVIGFISYWEILDEINITNIVMHKDYRGYGLSKILIDNLINLKQGYKFFLEVRKSNYIAINLYKKFNFKQISVRDKYYKDPTEDALVMKKF